MVTYTVQGWKDGVLQYEEKGIDEGQEYYVERMLEDHGLEVRTLCEGYQEY